MEFLRLGLLRGMPYFGDHKEEESTSQILLGAWEDICELIVSNSGDKSVYNGMDDFDDGFADEEANFNMSMRRGLKLKENVNEFVERNPQIAAKLLQSWLKENDE